MEIVILVDDGDNEIGALEKMEAHKLGLLHRAFSIFIFNSNGEMLLQQRAFSKYHSGGLWSNACCGHPRVNESTHDAANRRLNEELGFNTLLHKSFHFKYSEKLDKGLYENEIDHVFVGKYDGLVYPDSEEVRDFCYKPVNQIELELSGGYSNSYTVWFKIIFPKICNWLSQKD
jgi:isopentenyl-diphosphate Delta-isomerase